jgi:aspartate carbamoyltransferase
MAANGNPIPLEGEFAGKSIVSIDQFSRADVETVLSEAATMAELVRLSGRSSLLHDKIVANLFYEPSTRTFLSFEAAAQRLGAGTIATQGVEYSSISKGETLEDTIRTVERYADIIALRHSEQGAATRAATVAHKPVINAGDGTGEHPTQALLDLFTIRDKLGHTDNLRVTMVGDLKHGRTVHSLARLLTMYGVQLHYVSPPELAMPSPIVAQLRERGARQYETVNLGEVLDQTDVVYMTRIQKERFTAEADYQRYKGGYVLDRTSLGQLALGAIVMHPLPRVGEISPEVDADPRAVYFDEVENGMYVRMALLALVSGRAATQRTVNQSHREPAELTAGV